MKTSLQTEYEKQMIRQNFLHERALASPEGQKKLELRGAVLQALKDVGDSGDVNLIVDVEEISLTHRFDALKASSLPGRDRQEKSFLKAGIQRMEDAQKALKGVRDAGYRSRLLTTSRKDLDRDGLPKDSFRTSITGQVRSLGNLLRCSIDTIEKNILEQRIANLHTAEALYKDLQREALNGDTEAKQSEPKPDKQGETLEDFIQSLSPDNRTIIEAILLERATGRGDTTPEDNS